MSPSEADERTYWRSLGCREGVHNGCAECDCWCHDDEWEKGID